LNPKYTLGLDFGTSSARGCILNIDTGEVVSFHVNDYSGGDCGIYSDHNNPLVARQSPKDYLETLEKVIKNTLKHFQNLNKNPSNIVGIGIDSTGSTPIPVDQNLNPLMFQNKFKNNLNAYAWLWKDHSALKEASLITEKAKLMRPEYLLKCGGSYSSEWFWSKIWHCLNIDEEVFDSAYTWIEQSDFIPAMLAGIKNIGDLKRNICAAGHKAMFSETWGGLPDKDFLIELHPKLSKLRDSLYDRAYSFDQVLGHLSNEWSLRTGLPKGIPISVGALDAHVGAIGAGVKPGKFVKIIGTSTCDIMVFPKSETFKDFDGVSGIANDSVLPGYIGVEAGQSAVGDLLDWWVRKVLKRDADYHLELTKKAAKIKAGDSGLLALDWNNGNRNILADQNLSGLILGQTLGTQDYEIYRSLIEATAYGALKIIKLIETKGIVIDEVIATGGIGHKNKLFMQIYADVFGIPVRLVSNVNAVSVGAAIMGAITYKNANEKDIDISYLVDKLSVKSRVVFKPNLSENKSYKKLFKLYSDLHDMFGDNKLSKNLFHIMKALKNFN
tara:strand:+ start:853 stop:2517 length:1665 start_codon:yes stop_codon:yes gene_type:complete